MQVNNEMLKQVQHDRGKFQNSKIRSNNMKIGIDVRTLLEPEKRELVGVGHYTFQLISHLLKIDRKNQYVLFVDSETRKKDIKKFKQKNVTIKFFPFAQYKRFMLSVFSDPLIAATLYREKLDVYFSPRPSIPAGYRGNIVVSLHDLAVCLYPELFPKHKASNQKKEIFDALKKASKVITVSEAVKNYAIKIFNFPSEKFYKVYKGLDKKFLSKTSTSKEVEKAMRKYKVKGQYILFLGTIEPRKNITRLLAAYEKFKKKTKDAPNLVLAGRNGWLAKEYEQEVSDFGLGKSVIFTDYVSFRDLVCLLDGAKLFVFTPMYEGFGLPVLEAMARKLPVIISNVGSLPEITAGMVGSVDPYDIDGLASLMTKFLDKKNIKDSDLKKSYEKAREFSWDKCAKETLKILMS